MYFFPLTTAGMVAAKVVSPRFSGLVPQLGLTPSRTVSEEREDHACIHLLGLRYAVSAK
jgi:hypothetical protein